MEKIKLHFDLIDYTTREYVKKVLIDSVGKEVAEFMMLTMDVFRETFNGKRKSFYRAYSYLNETNGDLRLAYEKAMLFEDTVAPNSSLEEYYTLKNFNYLIQTHPVLKEYVDKFFDSIILEHNNSVSNAPFDYYLKYRLKGKTEETVQGEHKCMKTGPTSSTDAGKDSSKLKEMILTDNEPILKQLLFKVEYEFVNGCVTITDFIITNFISRLGVSPKTGKLATGSNNKLQIVSESNSNLKHLSQCPDYQSTIDFYRYIIKNDSLDKLHRIDDKEYYLDCNYNLNEIFIGKNGTPYFFTKNSTEQVNLTSYKTLYNDFVSWTKQSLEVKPLFSRDENGDEYIVRYVNSIQGTIERRYKLELNPQCTTVRYKSSSDKEYRFLTSEEKKEFMKFTKYNFNSKPQHIIVKQKQTRTRIKSNKYNYNEQQRIAQKDRIKRLLIELYNITDWDTMFKTAHGIWVIPAARNTDDYVLVYVSKNGNISWPSTKLKMKFIAENPNFENEYKTIYANSNLANVA